MHKDLRTLSDLCIGERCYVASVSDSALNRRRMLDLGIVPDTSIEAVLESPSGGITAYMIRGALIAIRHEDAKNIIIK